MPAAQTAPPAPPIAPVSGAPSAAPYQPHAQLKADLMSAAPPAAPATPGWYDDPLGQYRFRWWDGARWTITFHR